MVVKYEILFSRDAQKDSIKLRDAGLKKKAEVLLDVLRTDPYVQYPSCEKLIGNLGNCWSRRINIQHRIVYRIDRDERKIYILRMWGHYE